jgi:hypothetical protein
MSTQYENVTGGGISCLVTSIQNNLSRLLYFLLSHPLTFVYFYLLVIKDEFENIKITYFCVFLKLEYQVRRKSGYITNRIYTLGTRDTRLDQSVARLTMKLN